MTNEIEMRDGRIVVDGKAYTLGEIRQAVRFWEEYHWNRHTIECPICGSDLNTAGMFVCDECGKLLPIEEESPDTVGVCKNCDEVYQRYYQNEKAWEDAVNAKIDEMCGK